MPKSKRSAGKARKQVVDEQTDSGGRHQEKPRGNADRFFLGSVLVVCVVALFLRILHVLETFGVPTSQSPVGDSAGYLAWANEIAAGKWFGESTFYQAPAYPYFLAVLQTIGFESLTMLRIVQGCMGAATVALIAFAGRWWFTRRIGLTAATMLAVYPPAIYYDTLIQKAGLASFLLAAFLASLAFLHRRRRLAVVYQVAALVGVTLALLVLTRENALLWVPLVPCWLLWGLCGVALRGRCIATACFGCGAALILFPVAARNAYLGGEWSPTTFQAGPNFYIGNHHGANGIYIPLIAGRGTPVYERSDAEWLAEAETGQELSPRQVSRFWMQRAWAEIVQHPIDWIRLMAMKSAMLVNRYEVPDVESIQVYRFSSTPLAVSLPLWNFGVLLPIACWGMLLKLKNVRRLWLLYSLLLTMSLAIVGFFILGRYRQPLVPLLVIWAAIGFWDAIGSLRSRDWRSLAYAGITMLSLAILCNWRVHDEKRLLATSYMNVGAAAGKNGDINTAIQWLQRSLQIDSESAASYFNLGRAYSADGRHHEAIAAFRRAQSIDPELTSVARALGASLERIGDREAALQQYQWALQIDPSDQSAARGVQRISGMGR
ncbi:Tetratricopeptide TPR_2 repeat protein [Rhodopirellula maiorica SM1]|uniref:Tetratricopeptide TPR_2 repeat protein n=1 Tax=Rhodopirellula maiorica SM1 TaxID=1265738 RepID=M5RNK1_9BACT|nr:tetratricopeptide repeat protein [Rhodopirellula maiorica]EMI20898.1 Tetratricopeptide TPR_2 repeat protein [Rhodopirellula maiorica SM1]